MTDDTAQRRECQVLVIGSGVSGYCAAIQAGRCGTSTILLEKDAVLGGNSGPDLGVGITGAERYHAHGVETGIIQQLREEACWADAYTHTHPRSMGYHISRRFEGFVQSALKDANVTVLKRHYARRPIVTGSRIEGVIVEDLAAFRTVQIDVTGCVIEASGDGEVGALAGADFDYGTEGRDEYGERSAPPERTNAVQGTSLVAIAHRTDHQVRFVPPEGIPQFTPRVWHGRMSSFLNHHGGWFDRDGDLFFLYITETGGHMHTIRDDSEIYEMLLGQLWAEWDHIKNGPHKEEARNWDLLWVSPKAGKRESRRMLGDYVLTQTDVEQGRRFDDDIAYGGHDIDDHQPLGEGSNIVSISIPPLYGIPFRCCYSRNVDNLLLAGRLISATHLAHASSRIMGTGAAVGQAVGMAAAICAQDESTPKELGQKHIGRLQRALLREDVTLLCRPVPIDGDLARRAAVSATSELCLNDLHPDQYVPLLSPAGVVLWDWAETLDHIELYLRNGADEAHNLRLAVMRTRHPKKWKSHEEYRDFGWDDMRDDVLDTVHEIDVSVPAGWDDWLRCEVGGVELGPKDAASDDDRVLITMAGPRALHWATAGPPMEIAQMIEYTEQGDMWRKIGHMGAMRLHPPPQLGEAANVINGFSRRFSRGPTNMWMSRPEDGLPQALTLQWGDEQTFSSVTLVFDTLRRDRHEYPWEAGKRASEMCVKDYELQAFSDGKWRQLVAVTDNFRRVRTHQFEPVTLHKLRLRILSAHDERPGARVYGVEVRR